MATKYLRETVFSGTAGTLVTWRVGQCSRAPSLTPEEYSEGIFYPKKSLLDLQSERAES